MSDPDGFVYIHSVQLVHWLRVKNAFDIHKIKVQKVTVPLWQTTTKKRFFQDDFKSEHWLPALLVVPGTFALIALTVWYGYVLDDAINALEKRICPKRFPAALPFSADSLMGYFQKKDALYLLEGGRYRPLH